MKESGVLYKPGATMGVRDSSVTLNLSQDELLITKTIAQADILQLTQTVSQKQHYRSKKARLVHLEAFL